MQSLRERSSQAPRSGWDANWIQEFDQCHYGLRHRAQGILFATQNPIGLIGFNLEPTEVNDSEVFSPRVQFSPPLHLEKSKLPFVV